MFRSIYGITFGSDPEGFFERDGKIIGSEKVLGEAPYRGLMGSIVRDGVQFELHPLAALNAYQMFTHLKPLFVALEDMEKQHGVKCNFNGLVTVTREELDSLSPECRVLGCMPSENYYGAKPINVDPVTYRKRSSGGHIHMGLPSHLRAERDRLVPLMDIYVGNACVLLDRDRGAVERRKNYGRAGEYRLPSYGVEYRTLSNFWLRAPQLLSLVIGLANMAICTLSETIWGNDLEAELANAINIRDVIRAINKNDWNLAMRNFERLAPFIAQHATMEHELTSNNLQAFMNFANKVNERGIEQFWSTEGIVQRWTDHKGTISFARFLTGVA